MTLDAGQLRLSAIRTNPIKFNDWPSSCRALRWNFLAPLPTFVAAVSSSSYLLTLPTLGPQATRSWALPPLPLLHLSRPCAAIDFIVRRRRQVSSRGSTVNIGNPSWLTRVECLQHPLNSTWPPFSTMCCNWPTRFRPCSKPRTATRKRLSELPRRPVCQRHDDTCTDGDELEFGSCC